MDAWESVGNALSQYAHDVEVYRTSHIPPRFQATITLTQGQTLLFGSGVTILEALQDALLRKGEE